MSYRRLASDRLPPTILAPSGETISLSSRLEETEHNVEDLLLCLEAVRPDDVPSIHWSWQENAWHPDALPDEHYPQYFSREIDHEHAEYRAIWSAPLCRRDPAREWHDGERYLQGVGRQALLFDYQFRVAIDGRQVPDALPLLIHDSLSVVAAMHDDTPPRRAFASTAGNKIKVDARLLIKLMQWIDELKHYLRLEEQALAALARRSARPPDLDLHSNE